MGIMGQIKKDKTHCSLVVLLISIMGKVGAYFGPPFIIIFFFGCGLPEHTIWLSEAGKWAKTGNCMDLEKGRESGENSARRLFAYICINMEQQEYSMQ